MYEALLTFCAEHLFNHIVLIVVSTFAMIFAMAADLYFGVQKAKLLHRATTSTGFKKTCEKARKYFSPYFVLICIDFIACVLMPIPAFSMLWAAYCTFCEFKSVREKAWEKEELRKAERTMSIVIENKDDIAKLVAKILFESQTDKNKE